ANGGGAVVGRQLQLFDRTGYPRTGNGNWRAPQPEPQHLVNRPGHVLGPVGPCVEYGLSRSAAVQVHAARRDAPARQAVPRGVDRRARPASAVIAEVDSESSRVWSG